MAFKNKVYRSHLGREGTSSPPINTSESKAGKKEQYIKLMKKIIGVELNLFYFLGVSRAWVKKVLNQ